MASTLLLILGSHATAQEVDTNYKFDQKEASVFAADEDLVHGLGMWVRSHFLDSWYAQIHAGPLVYNGTEDNKGPWLGDNIFTDGRQTYHLEAKLGRWVYPKLGYRFGLGYGYCHGFLTKDTYNGNEATVRAHAGQGVAQDGYPGYYWDYNDELLIQKWKYASVTAEMMIKLINVRDYNHTRPFHLEAILGVGMYNGLSERLSKQDKYQWHLMYEIHGGLMPKYRIDEHWSVYAELRATIMDELFDREHVLKRPTLNEDLMFHGLVGVEYNFNWRGENARTRWDEDGHGSNSINNRTNHHVYTAHQVSIEVVNYVDTIFSYDTVDEFSPDYDSLLVRRARQHVQRQIDSLRMAFDRDCKDAGLDDILNRHLLPYEMVFFELDKWDILPEEELKIRKMAAVMKQFPNSQFLLIGSADSKTGTVKRNEFLSVNRSDVVYNQLVNLYDINPEQLRRVYMGGILDFDPFELNRATVIIMDHPKVMEEFNKLKAQRKAGGSEVELDK